MHFWSNGCSFQFRSENLFQSLCLFPVDIKFFWDYGEAHHFQSPHDGIECCIKKMSSNICLLKNYYYYYCCLTTCRVIQQYHESSRIIFRWLDDYISQFKQCNLCSRNIKNLLCWTNQIDLYFWKLITVTYVDDGECSHESDVEEEFAYLQNTIIWTTQLTFYQDA